MSICIVTINSLNPREPTIIAASADTIDLLIINIRSGLATRVAGMCYFVILIHNAVTH